MSGIGGIYNLDGRPLEAGLLQRMTHAIEHRGPDAIRQRVDGPIGLSNLLLQAVPESYRDEQPIVSEDHLLSLTMDGRIDNRNELRAALESAGFRSRGQSDAELVLNAYKTWGEECPNRLLGDFAFAIWDQRKRQLFCARDYVGIRPFYYYRTPSLFVFGSEIRAVLTLEMVSRRLNESRLADLLVEALDREDEESTFYEKVLRLPAGHCLTIAPGRFAIRDYWNLKAPPTLKLKSLEEYGEAFREVFTEAVRCRLISSHRVGSTLSGGIDSSSVVCTTRQSLQGDLMEPLHTISLVDSDKAKCGETPYIEEVLRGGWIVPHIVPSDQAINVEKAMGDGDEPFEFARYFPNWFIFSTAHNCGIRVLLDGVSGDHITAPYAYLSILIRSLRWKKLVAELIYNARVYDESIWRSLLGNGFGPLLPNLSVGLRRRIRKYRKRSQVENPFINSDFAARMKISERFENRSHAAWYFSQNLGTLHSRSFTSGTLPFFFEHSGRMAALRSVEPRHPFSDRRMIEFFLSLPLEMKTYSPLPKRVIREGMKGILPERVRNRTHFSHPGGAFLRSLLSRCSHLLQEDKFKALLAPMEGYVNVEQLQSDRLRWLTGASVDGYSLWQVLNLAIWMQARGCA